MSQSQKTLERRTVIRDLLASMGLYPEEVLVLVNGILSTEDQAVEPDDDVEIIRIISSG